MDTTTQSSATGTSDTSTSGSALHADESLLTAEERARRYRARLTEGRRGTDLRLRAFLLAKAKYYRSLDRDARNRRLRDIDSMIRYLNGDQYGQHDESGVWQQDTLRDGDYAYTIPIINGHVEETFTQLLKTKIEYIVKPKDNNDDNKLRLANMCESLALEEMERLFTEDVQQTEIMNTIVAGESPRYIFWSPHPDNPKTATRAKLREQIIELPSRRECEACKSDVPDGAATCPDCGATFIKEYPAGTFTKTVEVGEETVSLGENLLHIPHPMSVQRDLSASKPRYSTFIVERDFLPQHVAEWLYQCSLDSGGGALSQDMQLRYEGERATQQTDPIVGSNRSGGMGSNYYGMGRPRERERFWLEPADYAFFYCAQAEQLPNGDTIPANTLLGDYFKEGLYFSVIGESVLEVEAVNKNRKWSIVFYNKRVGTGIGAGLQNLMPLQDIVNDTFNLDYAVLMTSARPMTAVDRRVVKELPEATQFLMLDKIPDGKTIDSVIRQFPGQAASGIVGATAERIEGAMQFIAGTSTLGASGAPDMQAAGGTATGVMAMEAQGSRRMVGAIRQRVAADKETIFQLLENIRDYSSPEQQKELGLRFGPDIVKDFLDCNFRQIVTIGFKPQTDVPRSMALTTANMMAFGQFAAALVNVPWGPELLSQMADIMGISLDIGQGRNDRREAEYRLNKLAAIEQHMMAKFPQAIADADAAALKMYGLLADLCGPLVPAKEKPSPGEISLYVFMQDHTAFQDVYKDFLFGERAKTASDAMKLVVLRLWQDHFRASVTEEYQKQQLQAEMQGEIAKATQPEQPAQPSPEEVQAAQQQNDHRQLQTAAVEHQMSEEAKDNDLHRKMTEQSHAADLTARTDAIARGERIAPPSVDDMPPPAQNVVPVGGAPSGG